MTAYCMKCRAKREMRSPVVTKLRNGRFATKGFCKVCGTAMFRMGKT